MKRSLTSGRDVRITLHCIGVRIDRLPPIGLVSSLQITDQGALGSIPAELFQLGLHVFIAIGSVIVRCFKVLRAASLANATSERLFTNSVI
ncbi:hypothetical protein [Bradyrhizobium japonicum]|uniref:Uncharacterized protein n=1 Tax=Bradyrhizobium japonicum TaxID=375 RepID=A0A1L3FAQ9_BRAJP|nr:hypothetical protein [Bradyrhizobium japonicum]APG10385.1 hypothetical protein BKD09_18815 [Bradyrhizobium japonicum]